MRISVKTGNPNYLAKIVKLQDLRQHSNADRLQCCNIEGNNVITSLEAKDGDIYVYFPLECAINKQFLSWSNSFSSADMNTDKTTKGFFNKQGRVRAIKLRGERSEGYIIPATHLFDWLRATDLVSGVIDIDSIVGTEFDTIDDTLICEKYIIVARTKGPSGKQARKSYDSKLVENQFRFHTDVEQLKRNMHKISPDQIISVSKKVHGTSVVIANVLCKKKLNILEKALKFARVNIEDKAYDYIFSSRRVVKNGQIKPTNHYYDTDIWTIVGTKMAPSIKPGISVYAEIVGYLPTGSSIQKGYDYGQSAGTNEVYVYRITWTSPSGDVYEFSRPQIDEYCFHNNMKVVPLYYYGLAKNMYDISTEEHWHEEFLKKLMEDFTEKDCDMCTAKVPEEGAVIVSESMFGYHGFKLKSFRFLERETAELDAGTENLEDSQ